MIQHFNMDCLEAMREMKDNEFDLAIVDPPYRDENQPTKSMRQKTNGKMNNFGKKPTNDYFKELFRISKNQIIWGGNNFIDNLRNTNCMIFWWKMNSMENYSDGEFAWTSFDSVSKIFKYRYAGNHEGNTIVKNKIHPTQKPISLYEWLLMNYAKPGDKILDTHGGSFSHAIACHNLGFDLTIYELDPDYYKAGVKRLEQHQSQLTIF